jgi:glutamate/tyrosine decarboxylase-like PLP-dependent enzyme
VDWIADYRGVGAYPVVPQVAPGQIRDSLPVSAPSEGEPFEDILHDFDTKILPGITHWNHPGFFASGGDTTDAGELQDRVNMATLGRVNDSGEVFLSHTRLDGRVALRLSVGNLRSTDANVRRAWELLKLAADEI